MSPKTELELDEILAEFHTGQIPPVPAAGAPGERRRAAGREERKASPSRTETSRESARPRAREERADQRSGGRRRRAALGRALMCLILALLAAALWGLLRWNAHAELENQPRVPEPLRLELGEALEDYLGRAATSSQG